MQSNEDEQFDHNENQQSSQIEESIPEGARHALVTLLKHGVILAAQKKILFENVRIHQVLITARLNELYLKLVLDERAGIAYIEQQTQEDQYDEDDEIVQLISPRMLSLYDSYLLLILRKFYQERQALGEDTVMIDLERIELAMRPFLKLSQSQSIDQKKLSGAVKQFQTRKLLINIRGEENRFEISPIIRYVVDVTTLENLLAQYQKLLSSDGSQQQSNLNNSADLDQGDEYDVE